jgi:zinc protease
MTAKTPGIAVGLILILHAWSSPAQTNAVMSAPQRAYDPQGSYCVVVSAETLADENWANVVTVLRKKYNAGVIVYPRGQMGGIAAKLAEAFPRFACFVATPQEANRSFVVRAHRLTRRLDADPYTDLVWGILTGYDAADALRIASHSEPLVIKRAASSMGPGSFQSLSGGFASSETKKSEFAHKKDGGETVHESVSPDAIRSLVEHFNGDSTDMFVTSGHATERDWQAYYNMPGGEFRHENGQLYGLDSKKTRYPITSPNPKVYLPAGNCLIAHIDKPDCMATAWIHSGGAYQMYGYTAVTFFGYMGWGVMDWFGQPWNLADACFFTNQGLIYELNKKYPDQAGIEFATYDHYAIQRLAAQHKIQEQKLMGYLWDRDILAFYGDPAWIAHKPSARTWRYEITRSAESVTVLVEALAEGKWPGKPLIVPFTPRLKDFRSPACDVPGIEPVLVDNFMILPLMNRPCKPGDRISVTFGARPIDSPVLSATSKMVVIEPGPADAPAPPQDDKPVIGNDSKITLPSDMLIPFSLALKQAGTNRLQILKAVQNAAPGAEREDILFLLANMPIRDLHMLTSEYLLGNTRLARQAWTNAPWGSKIDLATYRNTLLPYASITEAREDWRENFSAQLAPVVKECKSAGEAALKLNEAIFDLFKVKYHATKRPRPDQGPLESIKASYASCSGLSVLLVDACRAVGVPARIAGIAQWGANRESGNHTWVEVRDDDGTWYALGASESKALNDVWFAKQASELQGNSPFNRIYATTFERGPLRFPFAWDPYADYVSAVDRTAAYSPRIAPPAKTR